MTNLYAIDTLYYQLFSNLIIFTNPSTWAGYDTRSFFQAEFNRFEFSNLMIVFLVGTPAQVDSLPHNLKQTTGYIVFHVNANKIENFKHERAISALSASPLKFIESSCNSEAVSHLVKLMLICTSRKRRVPSIRF